MSLPIVFRHIARREMDDSIEWYESEGSGVGTEFASEIGSLLDRITANPKQFRKVRGGVRQAVLRRFPYTIQFLLEPDRIVRLAVFHAKRNPTRLEAL